MIFPSDLVSSLRLRLVGGRLLCLLPLSARPGGRPTCRRQMALVGSPRAPYLRRLYVYRRAEPSAYPDGTPRAA